MYHYTPFSFLLLFSFLFLTAPLQGQRKSKLSASELRLVQMEGQHQDYYFRKANTTNQPGIFDASFKNTQRQRGYFHHVDSTGLYYAVSKADLRDASTLEYLPVTSIHAFRLRKKGSKGLSMLKGMAIGALAGAAIGFVTGPSEETCNARRGFFTCGKDISAAWGGIGGIFLGGGIGLATPHKIKSYFIQGKKHNLRAQEAAIKKFEYNQ
jgi:hypothetical protein